MSPELHSRLEDAARAGLLLIVCDYDGTLAPIVNDPAEARPVAGAIEALGALGGLERTRVALLSGRAVASLCALVELPRDVIVVGCHGAEVQGGAEPGRGSEWEALPPSVVVIEEIALGLERVVGGARGFRVERKPFGVALHYREAAEAEAARALEGASRLACATPGAQLKHGKMVVEVFVSRADKGAAIGALRERVGADAVVFIGDDVTDEDGFAVLRKGQDVGIKVGREIATRAEWSVGDVDAVARVLGVLLKRRAEATCSA